MRQRSWGYITILLASLMLVLFGFAIGDDDTGWASGYAAVHPGASACAGPDKRIGSGLRGGL